MKRIGKKEYVLVIKDLLKWAENGYKLTAYICPHCNKNLCTRVPTKDLVSSKGYWDSAKQCYKCGKLSFLIVYPTGRIKVRKIGR